MTFRHISVWGGLVLFGAGSAQASEPDPCDFAASTVPAFSREQVMACYQSVPFDAADLANIVQVVAQHRSFSDLGEIYDERVHWKQALAALDDPSTEQDYPNDLALHDALKREHQRFRNAHVSYQPPACYWRMLNAVVPLDFGSAVSGSGHRAEQIVFVEGAGLVELYRQVTGIDLGALIGQRVVSINGVPVLDYFRAYTEGLKSHEDPGGGLNGVLSAFTYSLRLNGPFDFVPDRAADEYVFESVKGERQSLALPWVFIPSSILLRRSGAAAHGEHGTVRRALPARAPRGSPHRWRGRPVARGSKHGAAGCRSRTTARAAELPGEHHRGSCPGCRGERGGVGPAARGADGLLRGAAG